MARTAEADTKTLILDAAELAFAEQGFDASLRHIIAAAGVNLAAVHYHFGSKEALISAVFARRLGPLNKERLRLLDAAEASSNNGLLGVDVVLESLVGPALKLAQEPATRGLLRLFGRSIAEPNEAVQRIISEQFGNVVRRFTMAFRHALPELPEAVLLWRIQFVIGAMGHVMCDPQRIKEISAGLCDPRDTSTVLKEMVTFLAVGMRAPVRSPHDSKMDFRPG